MHTSSFHQGEIAHHSGQSKRGIVERRCGVDFMSRCEVLSRPHLTSLILLREIRRSGSKIYPILSDRGRMDSCGLLSLRQSLRQSLRLPLSELIHNLLDYPTQLHKGPSSTFQ
jgi:hypothetical protein